jgi:hypothetical protein
MGLIMLRAAWEMFPEGMDLGIGLSAHHLALLVILLTILLFTQQSYRYHYVRAHKRMTLKSYSTIVSDLLCIDFPFISRVSMEFGQFRTFGIPSIGKLLAATGQYENDCQKRYDDTDLILREFIENGPDTPRARAAILRLNEIHGHYKISNDDFLYTLLVFVVSAVRFFNKWGYRSLLRIEIESLHLLFVRMGNMMNITDIPQTFEAMEEWFDKYEESKMAYSQPNNTVAEATLDLLCTVIDMPFGLGNSLLRGVLRQGAISLMDGRLRTACGLRHPGVVIGAATHAVMTLRWVGERFLCVPMSNMRRTEPSREEGGGKGGGASGASSSSSSSGGGCPFMFGSASGKPVEGTCPMTGRSVATPPPPTATTTTTTTTTTTNNNTAAAAAANAAEKVDAGAARRRVMWHPYGNSYPVGYTISSLGPDTFKIGTAATTSNSTSTSTSNSTSTSAS